MDGRTPCAREAVGDRTMLHGSNVPLSIGTLLSFVTVVVVVHMAKVLFQVVLGDAPITWVDVLETATLAEARAEIELNAKEFGDIPHNFSFLVDGVKFPQRFEAARKISDITGEDGRICIVEVEAKAAAVRDDRVAGVAKAAATVDEVQLEESPQCTDAAQKTSTFFIGHSRRCPAAETTAETLHNSLTKLGFNVWLDVKEDEKNLAAMKAGVENADVFLAIVTGPCEYPKIPTDDRMSNAYFCRWYCTEELRFAKEAGVFIQPIVLIQDKPHIGDLMRDAPPDLKDLKNVEFIDVDRDNKGHWEADMDRIVDILGQVKRGDLKPAPYNGRPTPEEEARHQPEEEARLAQAHHCGAGGRPM